MRAIKTIAKAGSSVWGDFGITTDRKIKITSGLPKQQINHSNY
ncbi:hypothetical protein [Thalassoporum mexicanum]|nr:hypothetical protein [Pseudanabaena sp. PCC 7367]